MQNGRLATVVLACLVGTGAVGTAQSTRQSDPKAAQTIADLKAKVELALRARVEAVRATVPCVNVMPTIPVDPALDAAMRKNPPPDTTFRIKTIQPPPCIRK